MKLPQSLLDKTEWALIGPLGPSVPENLQGLPILAIDGGANHNCHYDVWVGDADSVKQDPKGSYAFHQNTEKDLSDLALGLDLLRPGKAYRLHLWGFLGGRKDHELFNLGEAMRFLETRSGSEVLFYDGHGKPVFRLFGSGEWQIQVKGVFSLGTLRDVKLRLMGQCKYQVPHATIFSPLSSLGLSNEGAGKITLYNEGPVFLYFAEKT